MLYTDLNELKKVLDIDIRDTSEDIKLNFFVEYATSLISEVLNRPSLSYQERTEYYSGTGSQKLMLRYRPVYTTPTIQVYVDRTGYFGAASGAFTNSNDQLTYGQGFCLDIDQPDGTSRSAILYRINSYWTKPFVRQDGYLSPFLGNGRGNIKIIYTAGYTVNNLPPVIRAACNLIIARMRYFFPLGLDLVSESYEDRHIAIGNKYKDYFTGILKPLLWNFRNYRW